ncbi:hypothetical protein [Caulobacter sp. SSI4214]|uniref:hypothetical protein n=1 Tax=Caulobacter sp. SSI4214 TaxID=2575739 RepID=UPI00143B1A3F|nr:hypothetical protein [Caulobacter sp. SSI4214]
MSQHTFVWLLFALVTIGPLVYRLIMPVPPSDAKAIEVFLRNRDQVLVNVRKIWIGGPSHWGGRGVYKQTGRPYRVTAQSPDGSRWTHDLAADGKDVLGNTKLKQRTNGVWCEVFQ